MGRLFKEKGASIDAYSGNSSFGVSLSLLSKDLDLGLEILSDCIINADFKEEQIDKEKRVVLASIKSLEDNLFSCLQKAIREAVFLRFILIASRPIGTKESIATLSRDDLLSFKERFCQPDNMVLAVFGDVEKEEVIKKVEKTFKDFKGSQVFPISPLGEPEISGTKKRAKGEGCRAGSSFHWLFRNNDL